MRLAAAAATLAALASSAAVAQPPTIDIQNTCTYAASAMGQLVKDWSTYSSTDRSRCVRTRGYLPSYVEWLTCLEMERDVRKMNFGEQHPSAPMTLPIVRYGPLW